MPVRKKTRFRDITIEGYAEDYIFETIQKTDTYYESAILDDWRKYFEKSRIFFDVGANLGNHTVYFSKNTDAQKIYSFEPFIPNYENLVRNIENNNISEKVIPINKGVGETAGCTKIKSIDESNYGSTTLENVECEEGDIQIVSIDSFVLENNLEMVDFVKIDTEGFECSIINGMRSTIKRFKPDLWIEISEDYFEEINNKLKIEEYKLCDIKGNNFLYLHPTRHDALPQIEMDYLIAKYLYYLERTNFYYQSYNVAKEWNNNSNVKLNTVLEDRNHNLEKIEMLIQDKTRIETESKAIQEKCGQLIEEKQELIQKDKDSRDEINKINNELVNLTNKLNKTLHDLSIQVDINENLEKELKIATDELVQCAVDYQDTILKIESMKSQLAKLEMNNKMLLDENKEANRQLDIIRNNKIGQLGIRLYQVYKKIFKRS